MELIRSIEFSPGRVTYRLNEELKSILFVDDMYIEIDGVDFSVIPTQVLMAPFLLNVAPVIWVGGIDVTIEEVDTALMDALVVLKQVFSQMYPSLNWSGNIHYNNLIVGDCFGGEGGVAVLYSGGLDSTTSSYRYLGERQTLVTIRGADVSLIDDSGWEAVVENSVQYGQLVGSKNIFVQSNFKDFVNKRYLIGLTPEIPSWWAYVQHGIGLTGLMVIPAYLSNCLKGVISSTHSIEFGDAPWGSRPDIDSKVAVSNFKVIHDGYELSRQGKMEYLVSAVRSGAPVPMLRVCHSSAGGSNCGECEKCCRTMTGLLVAGADYEEYGFNVERHRLFELVRRGIEGELFRFDKNQCYQWQDIQRGIKKIKLSNSDVGVYLAWLLAVDFDEFTKLSARRVTLKLVVKSMLMRYPSVWKFVSRTVLRKK